MIISASRRTDIPAFYADWLIRRVRAGYCHVPNPFNANQVSTVSLKPEDVDVIVFWSRHPLPLLPYLDELDSRGYRYYFQYTLIGNPRSLDRRGPALQTAIRTFKTLSARVGAERVIWRYDPIVFTSQTPPDFHRHNFEAIARQLDGYTRRCVISIMDEYPRILKRIKAMEAGGVKLFSRSELDPEKVCDLLQFMAGISVSHGIQIFSCAEEDNWQTFGIQPGQCIDDDYIRATFNIEVSHAKDPSQRPLCGCVTSKDIGMYDTCCFECQYCYANGNFRRSGQNFRSHNPDSPSLV